MTPPSTRRPFLPSAWLMMPAVFGLALLAYWPAVRGGVLWDDPAHLTIPSLQSWSGLWRILTQWGATQEYYPILHGAFWVEHRLWGDFLPAYHLLNILLHAASACLLALILRRLWGTSPGAALPATPAKPAATVAAKRWRVPAGAEWLAAFVFAIHPVAVESVAWITEQKNTLSVFFYLMAALMYLRFDDKRRWGDYAVAMVAFLLALGAKTATITLPAALLVVMWWRYGRIAWRRDVVPVLPWFALSIAAGLVTVHVETNFVGAKGAAYALTFVDRLLLAPRIVWFYIGKIVWPHDLLFYYPRWNVPAEAPGWWGYAIAVVAVTILFWAIRSRARGPLAGWLLFLGAMFPVIGFFNVFAFIFSYVADHFQYMPCFTLIAAGAGMGAASLGPTLARVRYSGCILGAAIVIALAIQTHRLSALYLDNETLFGHVIAANPEAWMAHEILGTTYAKTGRSEAAIAQYRDVLRLKPDHPDAYHGLGLELEKQPGKKAEAVALFEEALRLRPRYVEAHYNLGILLAGDPARRAEAIEHLRVAAGLQPYFSEAQLALGNLLAQNRATLPEGLQRLEAAVRFKPDSALMHRGYADALARASRPHDAINEYETALRLEGGDAVAHFHLADVLVTQAGRISEAISQYETALRLDPNLAEAHAHLAGVLSHEPGRLGEAMAQAEAALKLSPRSTETHNLLAIICAQQGDFSRARAEWEAALAINPQYQDARRNLQILDQMRPQPAGR